MKFSDFIEVNDTVYKRISKRCTLTYKVPSKKKKRGKLNILTRLWRLIVSMFFKRPKVMFSKFTEIDDESYAILQDKKTLGGSDSKSFSSASTKSKNALVLGTIIHELILMDADFGEYKHAPQYPEPSSVLYKRKELITNEYEYAKKILELFNQDKYLSDLKREAKLIERGFICRHLDSGIIIRCKFDMVNVVGDTVIISDLKTASKPLTIQSYKSQLKHYLWCTKKIIPNLSEYKVQLIVCLKNGENSTIEIVDGDLEPYTDEEMASRCLALKEVVDHSHLNDIEKILKHYEVRL